MEKKLQEKNLIAFHSKHTNPLASRIVRIFQNQINLGHHKPFIWTQFLLRSLDIIVVAQQTEINKECFELSFPIQIKHIEINLRTPVRPDSNCCVKQCTH